MELRYEILRRGANSAWGCGSCLSFRSFIRSWKIPFFLPGGCRSLQIFLGQLNVEGGGMGWDGGFFKFCISKKSLMTVFFKKKVYACCYLIGSFDMSAMISHLWFRTGRPKDTLGPLRCLNLFQEVWSV